MTVLVWPLQQDLRISPQLNKPSVNMHYDIRFSKDFDFKTCIKIFDVVLGQTLKSKETVFHAIFLLDSSSSLLILLFFFQLYYGIPGMY